MENPEEDWETHEACDDCGGKMGWVLDKGLTVGKRILVTGFVMTSAPIVLPPVLVISAIGFVCSIPYGFFLASYACTEKLMSILLPVSATSVGDSDTVEPSQPLLGYEVHDDDVGSTYRRRGFGKGEKPLFRALDFDVEEKGKSSVVGGLGLGEGEAEKVGMEEMLGGADDVFGVVINIETDEKPGGNAKEAQAPLEVTNISIDVLGTPAGHKEEEMVKETIGLIEKMRDEGIAGGEVAEDKKIDSGKKVNEAPQGSAGMEGPVATREPKVTSFSESKKDDAIQHEEKKAQGAKGSKLRKGKAKGGKQVEAKEKEVSGAGKATTTPAGLQEIGAASEEKGGRVISSYAVHKMADPLKIAVSPGGYDLTRVEITPAESAAAADQELYSEEQIRKQIDAMRKIVGCTTPRHETFIEELKELYILTGVEPPTSFKDLSGIVEVNHNLRFLMSIVGVK